LKYNPTNTIHPSEDPKPLLWATDETRQDIGRNDYELLYVVLSDTRLSSPVFKETNYHALVATPPTARLRDNPYTIRAQDAFGRGDFDAEIVVNPKSGDTITAVFRVHITDDWRQISMERIS